MTNQRFEGRSIRLSRDEAEFLVDACERDCIPQWMQLAAEIREAFGMSPYPAGSEDANAKIQQLRELLREVLMDDDSNVDAAVGLTYGLVARIRAALGSA